MPMIEANHVELYYELYGGRGDPMILIHGSWSDHNSWNPVVPGLSENFRVVTYDRRGHSNSPDGPSQGTAEQDSLDTAELIENLGLAPAHVVGSSFGGTIALKLATQRPTIISSLIVHEPPLFDLILDDPAARPLLLEGRENLERAAHLVEEGDKLRGAQLFTEALTLGPGSWGRLPIQVRETMVANANTWLDETRDPAGRNVDLQALGRFDKPTLLMYGGRGLRGSKLITEKLGKTIPNSKIVFDPNGGHTPQVSNPAKFVKTVTEFARPEIP